MICFQNNVMSICIGAIARLHDQRRRAAFVHQGDDFVDGMILMQRRNAHESSARTRQENDCGLHTVGQPNTDTITNSEPAGS